MQPLLPPPLHQKWCQGRVTKPAKHHKADGSIYFPAYQHPQQEKEQEEEAWIWYHCGWACRQPLWWWGHKYTDHSFSSLGPCWYYFSTRKGNQLSFRNSKKKEEIEIIPWEMKKVVKRYQHCSYDGLLPKPAWKARVPQENSSYLDFLVHLPMLWTVIGRYISISDLQ